MRFLADDLFEPALDLNDRLVTHPSATFFMRRGEDILIVDRALEAHPGDLAVAVADGGLTLRTWEAGPSSPRLRGTGEPIELWGIVTYEIKGLRARRLQ